MNIRMDDEFKRAVVELAAQLHISQQEVLRTAVLEKWARDGHAARFEEALEATVGRYGDLLERLAKA